MLAVLFQTQIFVPRLFIFVCIEDVIIIQTLFDGNRAVGESNKQDCFPMNLEKFNSQDGKLAMLTKGDNNQAGAGTALHIG